MLLLLMRTETKSIARKRAPTGYIELTASSHDARSEEQPHHPDSTGAITIFPGCAGSAPNCVP